MVFPGGDLDEASEAQHLLPHLKMTCPTCGSARIEVCEVSLCVNGTRRRRMGCVDCKHRWTTWDGPKPPPGGVGLRRPPSATTKKRGALTDEQVRQALIRRDLNNAEAARVIGCSAESVRQIRAGLVYRQVHPELLRPNAAADAPPPTVSGPSCHECVNWTGARCGFGFPDPLLEGLGFASDCDLYEVSQSMSLACPTSVQ
jgi:hypothetical protein